MKRYPVLRAEVFLTLFTLVAMASESTRADLLGFSFTATVTSISDDDSSTNPDEIFGATVSNGDSLSGFFVVDSDAAATSTVSGAGGAGSSVTYEQIGAVLQFSVSVGSVVFESDGTFLASVANDYVPFAGGFGGLDSLLIGDGAEPGTSGLTGETILVDGAQETGRMSLQFDDNSATAFNSTAIPSSLNRTDFDQIAGRINGTDSQGGFSALTYRLETLSILPVPEPSTLPVLAGFAAALLVLRRDRSALPIR